MLERMGFSRPHFRPVLTILEKTRMTDGAQPIPLDAKGSSASRAWLTDIAPIVSNAALAVLGFLWLVVLAKACGFQPRLRNFVVFAASISLLPVASAAIAYWGGPDDRKPANRVFESINIWCAVLVLSALAITGIATWKSGALGFWRGNALPVVQVVLALHLALLAALAWLRRAKPALSKRTEAVVLRHSPRSVQTVAFAYAFVLATVSLFRIEPENKHFNGLFSAFFPSIAGGFPDRSQLGVAALLASFSMAVGLYLLIIEQRLERKNPTALLRIQKLALPLAASVAVVLCFDFSLPTDVLHYMTNIGPARHLMGGGTLMVDTFSQYGPGPVLLTYLAFQLGQPSFAVANIAVQLCNILFYVLFLVMLWQSTRYRLAALWLGLIVLLSWLSGWAYGEGNVNTAPSVLGLRYLPVMLMAVALASGAEGSRRSLLTFLASFLAALWSAEAIVGTLALHCGFLTLTNLRDRSYGRLVADLASACLPVICGLVAMSLGILVVSGKLPAFTIYLGYFASYNPVAAFWSVPFDGTFWSWTPFLLTVVVVMGICWLTVFNGQQNGLPYRSNYWLRRALPAALLTAITSAYFAGRAVDFVILIALLPLSLLLIPAILWLANLAAGRDRAAISLSAIPLLALLWMSSFSSLYLFRVGSPYSLVVQQCRDHGRCTPAALGRGISETLRSQLTLEPRADIWAMTPYDLQVLGDAKRLIDRFAAADTEVTVLLGENGAGVQTVSDTALMFAGKWHTWPRSFTFTDELVPELAARILAAPVALQTGSVIILRQDEANLGLLESSLLKLIRSTGSLCVLEGSTPEVAAYRFWKNGTPQPTGGCMERPVDTPTKISDAENQALQALPGFIGNIQSSGDALPNGPIDLATLRRAGVNVPSPFVRGRRLASFWGEATLSKAGKRLTLDLFGPRRSVCRNLLAGFSRISGVARVATTATLADEQIAPVTDEQAAKACAPLTGFVRLVLDLHP